MTIEFYDAVNNDGLFDVLGKLFYAQSVLNTARKTTVPAEVEDALDAIDLLPNTLAITESLTSDTETWARSSDALVFALQRVCESVLIEFVNADTTLESKTVSAAIAELVDQMESQSESVDQSTVACSVAAVGSPAGNGRIATSIYDGQGRLRENAVAETITVRCTSDGPNASLQFTGGPLVDLLSEDYAQADTGSGVSRTVASIEASSSLVKNGDMEDEDDTENLPDDWLFTVGVAGTTVKMTDVEVQTVTISGSPSAGHYVLNWQNADGVTQTTDEISYDASGSAVQSALRKLTGLEKVTVSTSGTSPNYTHTVTFTGRGGNVAQLTSTSFMTGGSIAHATTSAGTAYVFADGKAMEIDSDGTTLVTMQQRLLTLEAETPYAVNLWAICDVVPAAGVITIDLVDGTGGSLIADTAGTDNEVTFNAADLVNSAWKDLGTLVGAETVFRLPAVVPDVVYLRIRVSTAISAGTSVFLDHVAFSKMTELYQGGPFVACFSGGDRFRVDDEWTMTVSNDRAGAVQDWFNRNFKMDQLGELLPSNGAGAETIPDTVMA